MNMRETGREPKLESPKVFATTHWSVVVAAGKDESAPARSALETLCRAYWYPIYVYVRRKGHGPDDAQDLTQEFFAQLISKHHLRLADRTKGKFRTFLLTCFQNFLRNYQKHVTRAKRGGASPAISLQAETVDRLELPELAQAAQLEEVYDLHWARTVVERALEVVRTDYASSGRGRLFDALRPVIWGGQLVPLSQIALQLGISVSAVKVAVHRLRERFREALRGEVAHTVSQSDEIEDELRYLITVLSSADAL